MYMATEIPALTIEKYEQLRDQWKNESWISPTAKAMKELESFRNLITLGEVIIPLILKDIKSVPFIYIALYDLTEERPTSEFKPGDIAGIEQAWIDWGILKDLLSND